METAQRNDKTGDVEFVRIGGKDSLLALIDSQLAEMVGGKPDEDLAAKLALIEKQQHQEKVEADLLGRKIAAGIPERFRDVSFRLWEPEDEVGKKFRWEVREWLWKLSKRGCPSAVFVGAVGAGKTWMGCGVLNGLLESGLTAIYTTAKTYTGRIKESYRKDAKEPESVILERFASVDLLVLDEVGRQFETASEHLYLFDLINERYNRDKPTLFLSNLDLEEFKKFMGPAIMDRLREGGGKVLTLNWPSRRV